MTTLFDLRDERAAQPLIALLKTEPLSDRIMAGDALAAFAYPQAREAVAAWHAKTGL